jgi:uncharacterized protein with PQ loop repeat
MITIETMGWIGSVLFAVCGLPQAVECIKKGNAHGMTWSFLILWFLGEVFTLPYIINSGQLPLLFNYTLNFCFVVVILYYKIKPRKTPQKIGY